MFNMENLHFLFGRRGPVGYQITTADGMSLTLYMDRENNIRAVSSRGSSQFSWRPLPLRTLKWGELSGDYLHDGLTPLWRGLKEFFKAELDFIPPYQWNDPGPELQLQHLRHSNRAEGFFSVRDGRAVIYLKRVMLPDTVSFILADAPEGHLWSSVLIVSEYRPVIVQLEEGDVFKKPVSLAQRLLVTFLTN